MLMVYFGSSIRRYIRLMSLKFRLSSVTLVHATQRVELFGDFLAPSNRLAKGLRQFVLKVWKEIQECTIGDRAS